MPKPRLNVSLIAIVGEGLLSRLSFGLISFTLPLYARHLGLSLTEVGMLAATNSAVAVAAKPLLGWVADRFGLKRTLVAAIGLRSLVSLGLDFASAPRDVFAVRGGHGLSMSLHDPSVDALIAEHGGKKSVASAFAWYQTARMVAGSLSRALAGFLLALTAANYPLVFFIAFALSVLPLLVVSRCVRDERDATHGSRNPESSRERLAPTFVGVGIAKPADDMGKAAFRPAWGALMAHISSFDKRNRARTMSWMSMGEDAGAVVAPVLAGLLWSTWGITVLMALRALLAIATEVYALSITRSARLRSGHAPTPSDDRADVRAG